MPVPKGSSLNLADWIDWRRRAVDESDSGATGIGAMHAAIDRACPDRALDLVDQAAPGQTDPAELAWVRCRAWWEQSRWDEVRNLASSIPAEKLCEPLNLRILIRAAWTDVLRADLEGDLLRAVERFRSWIVQGGTLDHTADLAHLDAYRALVHEDDPVRAAREARLAASLYARLGECSSEIKARILCIRILAIEGHLASAADEARLAIAAAKQSGHPRLLVQALNAGATVAWRRGEWDQAHDSYVAALRLAEEFEDRRGLRAVTANRARLLAYRGELDAAARELATLEDDAANEACTIAAVIQEYRGQVELLRGRPARALAHFQDCLDRLDRDAVRSYERAQALLRKAEALLAMEEFEAASACTEEGLQSLDAYPQALERGQLLHLRALCRVQEGRPLEAARSFEESIRALRRTGDSFGLLRCLLDRCGAGLSDPRIAVSDATEALALATRLRRQDLEDRARRQLARAETRLYRVRESTRSPDRGSMVAASPAMRALCAEARIVGASEHPVLLQGETGTGKEVLARFLHECSGRRDRRFVAVNCAAIPEALFEREFFGHARGAFTGADRDGPGLVEEAASGTLFLDEVGELPPALQPKLLRLLQEGSYRRVGESRPRTADLRVISATNRSLRQAVAAGRFRPDLFYRLSWFELPIPPLRERSEDLQPLVCSFLLRQGEEGREIGVEPAVWRALQNYAWPGNVRELEAAIGSAVVRARPSPVIRVEHLPETVRNTSRTGVGPPRLDLSRAVRRTERELILEALRRTRFCRADAARLLGIGRNTLYEKMKKLGIRPESAAREAG
jgi:two-component system response regulator HydG